MRLIHTSDWHIGHELHGFDRGVEHAAFLDWLARQLVELRADALIITGDVYDTVNPPILAQQRLYRFLGRVLGECPHLEIVIIGGNHDSASRLELPKELLDAGRVHLFGGMPRHQGRPALEPTLVQLHDKTGAPRAICAAIPYLRPGDLPVAAKGESAIKTLYREVIEAANMIKGNLPLIVTGHLHMCGGAVSELSERRIVVGGEEAVSSDTFPSGVAYVALGHLHKPQTVPGQTTIRYAGSPFPMSVAEKDYPHGIVILDLDEAGGVKTDLLPIPRSVPFYRVPSLGAAPLDAVEGELRRLEIEDPGEDRRPFLEVAVQLSSAEPELKRRIEGALEGKPVRLTRIVRQTAGQGGALAGPVEESVTLNELEPAHVFARRHFEEYGTAPPDDLTKAFDEVLAGVLSPNDEPGGAA
jgi:exonuclease SbcD